MATTKEVKAMNIKSHKLLGWSICLIVLLCITIYIGQQKAGFHIDELYSYGLSNSYYMPFPQRMNEWVTGQDYLNYLTPSTEYTFQYDSVFYNQSQDVHPPLYYILFHSIASLFPGKFSPWIGLSLNIFCYLVSFSLLCYLAKCLTEKSWLSLLIGLSWALSIGALNMTMFIRMYSLLTVWQLCLVTLTYQLYHKPKQANFYLACLGIIITLGGLTHYYFYIFAGCWIAFNCLYLLWQRRLKAVFALGTTALSGLAIALMLFPASLNHITSSNRGDEVSQGLRHFNPLLNLQTYLNFLSKDLWGSIPSWVIIILLLAGLTLLLKASRNSFTAHFISMLSIVTGSYFIIIETVSAYQTARYIYSIYPFICLLTVWAIYVLWSSIQPKISNTWLLTCLSVFLMLALTWYHSSVSYLYPERAHISQISKANHALPVLVLTSQRWMITKAVDQLLYYDNIYPMTTPNMDTAIDTQGDFQTAKAFVLMVIEDDFDNAEVKASIEAAYPNHHFQKLYEDASLTYYLSTQP